jgi:hypothetical protein
MQVIYKILTHTGKSEDGSVICFAAVENDLAQRMTVAPTPLSVFHVILGGTIPEKA